MMISAYLLCMSIVNTLSYKCNYPEIIGPVSSHLLYKEDNIAEVKWIESVEYCRAKGDITVYNDAGQGKCEYSRDICSWNGGCIVNTNRENDSLEECQKLLLENELVTGLDRGRKEVKQRRKC